VPHLQRHCQFICIEDSITDLQAEDAIVSSCKHLFDRACIRECLELQQSEGKEPECPVCHIKISIDLEQEAVDVQENTSTARQGILSRLNIDVSYRWDSLQLTSDLALIVQA
jgi:hypothetical protein